MSVSVPPGGHIPYVGSPAPRRLDLSRQQWIGGAAFVVTSGERTLGAGECPALTARPPYATVLVPANTPFLVQNLSTDGVTIIVTG
jgi:hypothetical protein